MQFVEAEHFTRTSGRDVDLIVLHTMEAPETAATAENVASWFAGRSGAAPEASAHYCIDNDTIVQCVREEDVAWHAPGANHDGIGFEHAGFARQGRADWEDPYSRQLLERSSRVAGDAARRHGIPVQWLDVASLRAGRRGFTSHRLVSLAFHLSSHTDPGDSFPVERYLAMVRAHGGGGPRREAKSEPPLLGLGDKGWRVKRLEKLLARRGFEPGTVDGTFDEGTQTAVKRFQATAQLDRDGIVGPLTWRALERTLAQRFDPDDLPVLGDGDSGAAVRQLQGMLARAGTDPGEADGVFGPNTDAGVRRFQAAHDLEVDGVVGPKTWAALLAR